MDFKDEMLSVETRAEHEKNNRLDYSWAKEQKLVNKEKIKYQIGKLKAQIKELQAEKKAIKPMPSFKQYCAEHTYEKRVKYCRELAVRDGFKGFLENEDSREVE